jgi:hypothetical protein
MPSIPHIIMHEQANTQEILTGDIYIKSCIPHCQTILRFGSFDITTLFQEYIDPFNLNETLSKIDIIPRQRIFERYFDIDIDLDSNPHLLEFQNFYKLGEKPKELPFFCVSIIELSGDKKINESIPAICKNINHTMENLKNNVGVLTYGYIGSSDRYLCTLLTRSQTLDDLAHILLLLKEDMKDVLDTRTIVGIDTNIHREKNLIGMSDEVIHQTTIKICNGNINDLALAWFPSNKYQSMLTFGKGIDEFKTISKIALPIKEIIITLLGFLEEVHRNTNCKVKLSTDVGLDMERIATIKGDYYENRRKVLERRKKWS